MNKPPGVSTSNNQVCNTGYTYSTLTVNDNGNSNFGCFRNKN